MSKPAESKPVANAVGRPTIYSKEIADKICIGLAEGRSLRKVCADESLPSRATVYLWLQHNPEFLDLYKSARDLQAEAMVDDMIDIADEECIKVKINKGRDAEDEGEEVTVVFDAAAVSRNKLRVETRKWLAAKLKPKVYGNDVEESGNSAAMAQVLSDLIAKLPE